MAIVDRIKGICLKPKDEWQVIEGESTPISTMAESGRVLMSATAPS